MATTHVAADTILAASDALGMYISQTAGLLYITAAAPAARTTQAHNGPPLLEVSYSGYCSRATQ